MDSAINTSIKEFESIDISRLSSFGGTTRNGKELMEGLVKLMEEFKERFAKMFTEMNNSFIVIFNEQNSKITTLETEIKELKDSNHALKEAVSSLENRIDENEAYEKKATLILSGEELPSMEQESEKPEKTLEIALGLFKSKLKLSGIKAEDISIAHRLGMNPKASSTLKRDIMVKFSRRDPKNTVLSAARKLQVKDFYVSEQLTARRRIIAAALRKAKKSFPDKIHATRSDQGSIYVWIKPPRPEEPGASNFKDKINTMEKLAFFCETTLEAPLESILPKKKNNVSLEKK